MTDTVSIRKRPLSVKDLALPGHWEGGLLFDSHTSQMATLVERHTRYLMRVKVASKDTETVIDALIKQAQKLPREVYTFLTWDRGQEMADHTRFTLGIDIQIYVGDPHHPWQQEANEHTHGLLRQCFPKGMDVSTITQAELNAVVRRLNERPRTTLHVETPAERVN